MDAAKTAKAEKVFRSNLDNQFEKVEEQARRLALIKQELETLEAPTRRDVAEVRARIDETDRKFTKVSKDYVVKKRAFDTLSKQLEEQRQLKDSYQKQLTELLYESEKMKDRKLDEIEKEIENIA